MKKELVSKMNAYIANVGVEFVKLHNLHWNIVGKQFKSVHEYLEVLYDAMAEELDSVAEILKMNGEMPLASLASYLEVASIKELESVDISVNDALQIVLADMKELRSQVLDIRALASEEDQFAVSNAMEDAAGQYDKNIWFIESTLK